MTSYDVIIIGVGSMGSSACYFLASRGYKVLGLEQFSISHEQGSHAGQSRIIRKAYFEHSDYVPLMERAYSNWKLLEEETHEKLYYKTGLAYFGKPDHEIIKGVKNSASLFNIPLQEADPKDFPSFKMPANYTAIFEPDAGFVLPEKTIQLYASLAKNKGAEIHSNEKVIEWKEEGNSVSVKTDKNIYHADKLVITAGAWAGKLMPQLSKNIKVTRQFLAWVEPGEWEKFSPSNFPCWMIADDVEPGVYYGFPALPTEFTGGSRGLKLAHHHPAEITDPDHVNRQVAKEDENSIERIIDKYFLGVSKRILHAKICLYANSPDENFIIDKLPGYNHVVMACGFSGHGFKFVPAIGEILADLATEGQTRMPVNFLKYRF